MPSASRLQIAAADALRWWFTELRACLPHGWTSGSNRNAVSDIHLKADGIIVERRFGEARGDRWVEKRPWSDLDEEGWGQLQTLIEGTEPRLWLHPPDMHATLVPLPDGARAYARQAVQLQLAEIAPVDPAELIVEVAAVRTAEGVLADVVMARRSHVETITTRFADGLGHMPPVFAGGMREAIRLHRGDRATGAGLSAWQMRALLIIALLLAAVPVVTIGLSAWFVHETETAIAALAPAGERQLAAEAAARRAAAQAASLNGRVGQPTVSGLVEALGEHLPESAWLRSIERLPDGALAIEIDARDPDMVLPELKGIEALEGFQIASQAPNGDGRIRISLRVAG